MLDGEHSSRQNGVAMVRRRKKKHAEKQEGKLLHTVTDWTVGVIAVIALAVFLVHTLGRQVRMEGHSMEPTLQAGDTVLVNQLRYHFFSVERFDVVLFQNPQSENQTYIKRVIGLPGETVQIQNGVVLVDGAPLTGSGWNRTYTVAGLAETAVHLGEDEYFLLGDNGDSSEDSRFAIVGNVHRDQILGKIWLRVAPFSQLGFVGSGQTAAEGEENS